MRNNKGLTLIELMAVLVILSIIATITVPLIFKQVKENKDKLYEEQVSEIENAAQNWAADNIEKMPILLDETISVYLPILQTEGYIKEDIVNNKTGKQFTATSFVQIKCITVPNYSYEYKFIE